MRPKMARNARFWAWWGEGYVKITLRPGQQLTAYRGGQHEEGWSSWSETWEHCYTYVERRTTSDGRDCDGRLTQYWDCTCDLEHLQSVANDPELCPESRGLLLPDWLKVSASQRDYEAERMGY